MKPYCVYFLSSLARPMRTYIGSTNNMKQRLHQHNSTKKGARRTHAARPWFIAAIIGPFWSRSLALSAEWHAQHVRFRKKGIVSRVQAVLHKLSFSKWSQTSPLPASSTASSSSSSPLSSAASAEASSPALAPLCYCIFRRDLFSSSLLSHNATLEMYTPASQPFPAEFASLGDILAAWDALVNK